MADDAVDILTDALVREYLWKKGGEMAPVMKAFLEEKVRRGGGRNWDLGSQK